MAEIICFVCEADPRILESVDRAQRQAGLNLTGVPLASPYEDERQAAVPHWKEAIRIAVEMDRDTMNSAFGGGLRRIAPIDQTVAAAACAPEQRFDSETGARLSPGPD